MVWAFMLYLFVGLFSLFASVLGALATNALPSRVLSQVSIFVVETEMFLFLCQVALVLISVIMWQYGSCTCTSFIFTWAST